MSYRVILILMSASAYGQMTDMNPASMFLMDLSSGTSMNPAGWPMPMVMRPLGSWNMMFMGQAFLVDTQQSGPRGGDKLYSTTGSWRHAEHRAGAKGAFQADLMLSLEPATITDRSYPLFFQTGETAYGIPLADAQHPHNFIMALGFDYARTLSVNTTLELYALPWAIPRSARRLILIGRPRWNCRRPRSRTTGRTPLISRTTS